MTDRRPVLFWFRRDLRLSDHAGLTAARGAGGPLIPVFVLDPETEALGAAAKWRLGLGVGHLRDRLRAIGSDLVLRRGPALSTLRTLVAETGAGAVHWSRLYAPDTVARDRQVKEGLMRDGTATASHPGHLIHEPWAVATRAGGFFKVFTPFWRAASTLAFPEPLPTVASLPAPERWPASEALDNWRLAEAMRRGADVVGHHVRVGEAAAQDRLDAFLDGAVAAYGRDRDRPDPPGTSRLSENLTYGEISPRTVWHGAVRAREQGAAGAEAFLRQLGWREFAWHLLWHTPHIARDNWRPAWDAFPWRGDNVDAERWRRGMTGEPIVDAGMREMYVTGTMHNRVRMLVASYLTKHLLTHWRVGLDWFADCLTDWDPASNALGWQWVAGSGPDAEPYFRIYNPATQAATHDPDGAYRRRFLLGFDGGPPHPDAEAFFQAVPGAWNLSPSDRPEPLVDLRAGREAALAAYAEFSRAAGSAAARTAR
jgi:deoxyribodipyrimidine photo-lyase